MLVRQVALRLQVQEQGPHRQPATLQVGRMLQHMMCAASIPGNLPCGSEQGRQ